MNPGCRPRACAWLTRLVGSALINDMNPPAVAESRVNFHQLAEREKPAQPNGSACFVARLTPTCMFIKSQVLSLTAILCAIASLGHAAVVVSASDTAPTADASDQYYLPGIGINNASLVGGGGDQFTYVAHDRTSKGQTFTTGSNIFGYKLAAITVQHVQFASGSTFWNVANGAQFEFAFGSISGSTKTQIFHTTSATTNFALTGGTAGGTGKYITFNLSAESLPMLNPNTTYYFEITTTGSPLYFELNGTSANGYAGGQSFSGGVTAAIGAESPSFSTGDFAFHANLTANAGPIGFASVNALGNNGTTGGAGGAVVTVTTRAQLIQYATDDTPRIIQIPQGTTIDLTDGTFNVGTMTVGRYGGVYYCGQINNVITENGGVAVGSNKTIIGLGTGANLVGQSLLIANKANVIVRNLTISDVNTGIVEAGDGITVNNSHHVWIDHCTFRRISDGYIDIVGASPRYITVSWCHFDGYDLEVCSPHKHHYVNGFGSTSALMVTLHHNYFDRSSGRNPHVSGAGSMLHVFNNYYRDISFYCVASEDAAQTRLERCYFENSQHPHYYNYNLATPQYAGALQTVISENVYTGVSATTRREVGGTVFNPASYYSSSPQPASEVKAAVLAGAGAGKM